MLQNVRSFYSEGKLVFIIITIYFIIYLSLKQSCQNMRTVAVYK